MARERRYTLETLPGYATLDELLLWPKEDLVKLHQQCQEGRKCYIVDAQEFTGLWFEDAYNEIGELRQMSNKKVVRSYLDDVIDFRRLLDNSKYAKRLAVLLYSTNSISYGDVGTILSLKRKQVFNIVKKLEPFEILFARQVGSDFFVGLSPKGYDFYKYIKDVEREANI